MLTPKDFNKKLKEQFLRMQIDDELRNRHLAEYIQLVQLLTYMNNTNLYGVSYKKFANCFFDEILGETSKDYKTQALQNIQACLDAAIAIDFISDDSSILHITGEGVQFLEKNDINVNNVM